MNPNDIPNELAFLANKISDNDDLRLHDSGDEKDLLEDDDEGVKTVAAMMGAGLPMPEPAMRRHGNTGPKGVIADYKEAQEKLRVQREIEKKMAMQQAEKKAITVSSSSSSSSSTLTTEDLEDDEFLKQYRAQRIAQLRQEVHSYSTAPRFGFIEEITRAEYLDAVEKEAKDVFVVIHLYEQHVPACQRLNQILSALAAKFPLVKILKIVASQAQSDFQPAGLPAVLVYRNGDLFTSFVPITLDLGSAFTTTDVETLFATKGIWKSVTTEEAVARSKFYAVIRENYVKKDSDDEDEEHGLD